MSDADDHASDHLQHVAAHALARAEAARPFDAGLVPLDASAPARITNWDEREVSEAAAQRLKRKLGIDQLPNPDGDGTLSIPARELFAGGPSFSALRQIYARLRRPDGCPWDREQSELSTLPHIAEETEELREALEHGDWPHAAEELGDILGNVLMIAQIAEEHGRFTFEDVVSAVSSKLVRRHPHVFGNASASNPDEVLAIWNAVKDQERAAGAATAGRDGGEGQGNG